MTSEPEIVLTALVGALLADCSADPLLLLIRVTRGPAVQRIGGGGGSGREDEHFDELLLEAFVSTEELLRGWVDRKVGNRLDAEDLIQTALMRVYAAKPEVTSAEQLRAYLWTVTKNLVRDAWRRAATDRERLESAGAERVVRLADRAGLHFDDVVVLRQALIAALDTLPPREREAVVLRAYEGNTYAETARIMGVSTGTAKSYVHNALRRVRERLEHRP
ncbi:RNA polymerase sigma factor [Nocardia testacea]|uniref:RNA polymerase sigma factor n=1 Tax=Nocardia testacea TaxID=248551 RepID=UPI0033D9BEE8